MRACRQMPRSIGWLESGGSEEVGGGEPEVITKGVGEMVGEPGVMGRSGERRALGERFDGVQHPDPPPELCSGMPTSRAKRCENRLGGGQAGVGGELDQGAGAGVLGELSEHGGDCRRHRRRGDRGVVDQCEDLADDLPAVPVRCRGEGVGTDRPAVATLWESRRPAALSPSTKTMVVVPEDTIAWLRSDGMVIVGALSSVEEASWPWATVTSVVEEMICTA